VTKLNDAAKAALRDAGISQAAWIRANGYADGTWGGDSCGCPDDRCKDGFHHFPDDECGCLRTLLDGMLEMRLSGSRFAAAVVAAILGAHPSVEVMSGPDELGDGRQSLVVRVMSPERVLAALNASRAPADDALLLHTLHPDRDREPAEATREPPRLRPAPCGDYSPRVPYAPCETCGRTREGHRIAAEAAGAPWPGDDNDGGTL
jgi:hypothetical protein